MRTLDIRLVVADGLDFCALTSYLHDAIRIDEPRGVRRILGIARLQDGGIVAGSRICFGGVYAERDVGRLLGMSYRGDPDFGDVTAAHFRALFPRHPVGRGGADAAPGNQVRCDRCQRDGCRRCVTDPRDRVDDGPFRYCPDCRSAS